MTFKHVKFEDSPTMRALEKVAREKGLVKSDTITKTAQHPASVKQLTDAVASAVQDVENVYTIVARAGGLSDSVLNWVDGRVEYIKNLRSKGDAVNLNDIKEAEGAIDSLSRNLQPDVLHNYLPAFLTKGVSQDMIWNKIKPLLDHAKEQLTVAGNLATTVALQTKSSLTPSDNLMENILKLCSGLRRKGFEKQAAKLEADYFNYKQAQTLYETSKEKGEDLIEFAHPEGSHKLENVEGDEAVVEDILDKHLKSLEVVQKKPTGKLSNAKTLINEVKKALGQTSSRSAALLSQYSKEINNAVSRINRITSSELTFPITEYQDQISELLTNPTIDNLEQVKDKLGDLHTRLDPGSWLHYATFGTSGLSKDSWAGVQGLLSAAQTAIQKAIQARTDIKGVESATEEAAVTNPPAQQAQTSRVITLPEVTEKADALTPLYGEIAKLQNKVNLWKSFGNINANTALKTWVDQEIAALENISDRYSKIPDSQIQEAIPHMQSEIDKEAKDISAFEQRYVQVK